MPLFDLRGEELRTYQPRREEPADFGAFWQTTLDEARAHPLEARFVPQDFGMKLLETYDLTFSGYAGLPIKGWLLKPRGAGDLPCVVEYVGYGGGRGFPINWQNYVTSGYAHLVMDTRGQGSRWQNGDTPDLAPDGDNAQFPGFMTRGVLSPQTYYYRRLITDAVRAVEAARVAPGVDADRLILTGRSQGGALAVAVAGLVAGLDGVMSDVPFLSHFRRATEITEAPPYVEIAHYLKVHRDKLEQVFQTLAYFDITNFAPLAGAKALFAVALMDTTTPPSTVYAAYNHYAGPKRMVEYPYNGHEGGEGYHVLEKLKFLRETWGA